MKVARGTHSTAHQSQEQNAFSLEVFDAPQVTKISIELLIRIPDETRVVGILSK